MFRQRGLFLLIFLLILSLRLSIFAANLSFQDSPSSEDDQNGRIVKIEKAAFSQEVFQNISEFGKAIPKLLPFINEIPHKAEAVEVNEITYLSDGLEVKGFLLEPEEEGEYPCLIVNRGGNQDFGIWTPEEVYLLLVEISSWGYVVAASQYRGCAGGEGKEEFGGRDVDDILSLIPLLESRRKADARRMGMIGLSRGGMMTYLTLARTDRIKAAAVVGGVSDLSEWEKARPDMIEVFKNLIGGGSQTAPEALKARSAFFWPEKISSETLLLILHSTADKRVPPSQALAMASALLKTGHPFRLLMFEGGDHNLTEFWPEWLEVIKSWFKKYL
ncbi:MAG: alpha/beta hydrolase family protein [Acidobacteriota bacterium]